jgi:hypothetical protein
MKITASFLPLITALLVSHASAQNTISFTNSSTASGNNSFVDLTLGKFDTGLGTLTDVVVTVNFTSLEGSFTVTSGAVNAAQVQAAYGLPTLQQSPTNSLGFTPFTPSFPGYAVGTTPSLPASVPANSLQVFDIVSTNVLVNSVQNINSSFWNTYQAAGGVGSVVFQVANAPFVQVFGGGYTLDANAFTATANMTVTYTYNPSAPIPEPGTWAAGLLLLGGAAYSVWRRRKNSATPAPAAA